MAASPGLRTLAGVKAKPKPVAGAFVGEALKRLEADLGGDSTVALIFEAPKRPPKDDFDGLGAVTFTAGGLLWLPNLIGLSAFHVWSPFGLSPVLAVAAVELVEGCPKMFVPDVDEAISLVESEASRAALPKELEVEKADEPNPAPLL